MRDSLQLLEKFSKACSAVEQKWPCPYALKFIPSSDSAHWGHMEPSLFGRKNSLTFALLGEFDLIGVPFQRTLTSPFTISCLKMSMITGKNLISLPLIVDDVFHTYAGAGAQS